MSSILTGIDAAESIRDIVKSEDWNESLKFEFKNIANFSGFADVVGLYVKQHYDINLDFMHDKEENKLIAYYRQN